MPNVVSSAPHHLSKERDWRRWTQFRYIRVAPLHLAVGHVVERQLDEQKPEEHVGERGSHPVPSFRVGEQRGRGCRDEQRRHEDEEDHECFEGMQLLVNERSFAQSKDHGQRIIDGDE